MVHSRAIWALFPLVFALQPGVASAQATEGFWEKRPRASIAYLAIGHGPDTRDPERPGAGATTIELGGGAEWTLYDEPGLAFGADGGYLFPALHPTRGVGMISANSYFQLFKVNSTDRLRVQLGLAGGAGLRSLSPGGS